MAAHNPYDETVDRIMQTAGLPKRGFTEEEAAFYLGVSRPFLRQARMNGDRQNHAPGPAYIRIGRMIRYLREDLDTYLEQFRCVNGKGGSDDD